MNHDRPNTIFTDRWDAERNCWRHFRCEWDERSERFIERAEVDVNGRFIADCIPRDAA